MLLFTCAVAAGSLFLDFAGEETSGTLENVATCSGSNTCFTAEVTFQTNDGKTVSYKPFLQNSTIYEIDRQVKLAEDTGLSSKSVMVHYLESFPRLVKINLSLYLEYLNVIIWLFWSAVVTLIGWVANREKPMVLDFRKKK
jgi:hypothetical protein